MTAQMACKGFLPLATRCWKYALTCGSCCLALKAGMYRAERIWRLPAFDSRVFLWTLLPDSKALGSRPANFTHSRWDRPGGGNRSSPMSAMALVSAMPLMPVSNASARLSSGYWPIKASASAVRRSMRFPNWAVARLASFSTAFGVSWVAVSVCRWFLAAAFCPVSAFTLAKRNCAQRASRRLAASRRRSPCARRIRPRCRHRRHRSCCFSATPWQSCGTLWG